jgi:hypothetical protein
MHRMRRFSVLFGFAVLTTLCSTRPAEASSLLKPDAGRAYPDIAADINGKVNYTYDPATQTGVFHVNNTPYLLAAGPTSASEYLVQANSDTGVRSQELSIALDKDGNLLPSASNMYELWGTIVAGDQTFSGLLLKGTPTAFGAQDLGAVGVEGADIFDVELDVTGGALAEFFGKDAYLRLTPELQSTFRGKFDENFSAAKATSNTRGYHAPKPFPVPEPTVLATLLIGAGGLALRNRRRLARR